MIELRGGHGDRRRPLRPLHTGCSWATCGEPAIFYLLADRHEALVCTEHVSRALADVLTAWPTVQVGRAVQVGPR